MENGYRKSTKNGWETEKSCKEVTNINGFVINSSKEIDIGIRDEYNEIMGRKQKLKGAYYG